MALEVQSRVLLPISIRKMEKQLMNRSEVLKISNQQTNDGVLIPLSDDIQFSEFVSSILPLLKFSFPKITLFHVITAPVTTPLDPDDMNGILQVFESRARPIASVLEQQGYSVEIKTAVARSISSAILEEASSNDYALIFMLKRRKVGIRGFFSRSITQQVVERSSIPVISVLV
ncbi:universal stress protein [Candidatus Thorarchaeota archaeon]|nr:MAG: universal stress protein [Candidatus Thorarchaeota archaeon]